MYWFNLLLFIYYYYLFIYLFIITDQQCSLDDDLKL